LALLDGLSLPLFHDIELVSSVTLVDNLLIIVKTLFGETVSQLLSLSLT